MSEANSEPHANQCNSFETKVTCCSLTPARNQAPYSHSLSVLPAEWGRESEELEWENSWIEIKAL